MASTWTSAERRAERLEYYKRYHLANAERRRTQMRRRRGLPEPTRPEPKRCELCGRLPNLGKTLGLDHDHHTGSFRGWICAACNLGLGMLGDTLKTLKKAVRYLERAQNVS